MKGLFDLVSEYFDSVEDLDNRLSDRFDFLVESDQIERVQVLFTLPNSGVPEWCTQSVTDQYHRLASLIDYTRDSLTYRDYIDSITLYACDNYAMRVRDQKAYQEVEIKESKLETDRLLNQLYERTELDNESFDQFRRRTVERV